MIRAFRRTLRRNRQSGRYLTIVRSMVAESSHVPPPTITPDNNVNFRHLTLRSEITPLRYVLYINIPTPHAQCTYTHVPKFYAHAARLLIIIITCLWMERNADPAGPGPSSDTRACIYGCTYMCIIYDGDEVDNIMCPTRGPHVTTVNPNLF